MVSGENILEMNQVTGEFAQTHEYLDSLIYFNPFNKRENGHKIFFKKLFFLTNSEEK